MRLNEKGNFTANHWWLSPCNFLLMSSGSAPSWRQLVGLDGPQSAPHRPALALLQNHHLNNLNREKTRPQRKQPAPAEESNQSELLPVWHTNLDLQKRVSFCERELLSPLCSSFSDLPGKGFLLNAIASWMQCAYTSQQLRCVLQKWIQCQFLQN